MNFHNQFPLNAVQKLLEVMHFVQGYFDKRDELKTIFKFDIINMEYADIDIKPIPDHL